MAEQYREEREPTEAPQPEARTEDPATMVKTETPTSHGMMWAISSPTGGVLALVRDEAAADLVLTALTDYVTPDPPPEDPPEGWMSEQEISDRFEESQKKLRDAGQIQPRPDPAVNEEQQRDMAESPTRHTMPDEPPTNQFEGATNPAQTPGATPQPNQDPGQAQPTPTP